MQCIQNRDIALLHCDKCWREDISCFQQGSVAKESVKHLQMDKSIQNEKVMWQTFIEQF